jgi:hypothetical protein
MRWLHAVYSQKTQNLENTMFIPAARTLNFIKDEMDFVFKTPGANWQTRPLSGYVGEVAERLRRVCIFPIHLECQ